jgi:hypothetical protein
VEVPRLLEVPYRIVPQQQGNKDAWDHDVSQAQHGKLSLAVDCRERGGKQGQRRFQRLGLRKAVWLRAGDGDERSQSIIQLQVTPKKAAAAARQNELNGKRNVATRMPAMQQATLFIHK